MKHDTFARSAKTIPLRFLTLLVCALFAGAAGCGGGGGGGDLTSSVGGALAATTGSISGTVSIPQSFETGLFAAPARILVNGATPDYKDFTVSLEGSNVSAKADATGAFALSGVPFLSRYVLTARSNSGKIVLKTVVEETLSASRVSVANQPLNVDSTAVFLLIDRAAALGKRLTVPMAVSSRVQGEREAIRTALSDAFAKNLDTGEASLLETANVKAVAATQAANAAVKLRPGKPVVNGIVGTLTATSGTVSWQPVEFAETYTVVQEGPGGVLSTFADVKTTTQALAGLSPATQYRITVTAVNGAGTSEASEAFVFRTP